MWCLRMVEEASLNEYTKDRRGSWFKGGDYITLLNSFKRGLRDRPRKLYYALALIQLSNGARVSEAIDSLEIFCLTNKREVEVRVRKHVSDYRLVVIPKEVVNHRDVVCSELAVWLAKPEYKTKLRKSFNAFLNYHYRINTHTLRYLFITYNAHIPTQILARIVGHKRLDYLITYTTKIKANEILKELVDRT